MQYREGGGGVSGLTLWLYVPVGDLDFVEVCETFQKLQGINHDDLLVLDPAVL